MSSTRVDVTGLVERYPGLEALALGGGHIATGALDVPRLRRLAIRTGGLELFPRLSAAEHSTPFVRMPITSGVAALDELLGGGVDCGTTTLLTGPPGSGKSTVAVQYATAAAGRGDHAAVFAFDESREI